jgi:hypothetical protein
MAGGKATLRIRMEWSRLRNPSFSQPMHAGPDEPVLLASTE